MTAHRPQSKSRGGKCPNCGAPTVHEFRPFCSKRCAQLDLAKWFNEDYRIAAVEDAELGDDETAAPAPGERAEDND